MAAHNIQNVYIGEDIRDTLPTLIIKGIFNSMMKLPYADKEPIYYACVL
jgi:hypothetical protein